MNRDLSHSKECQCQLLCQKISFLVSQAGCTDTPNWYNGYYLGNGGLGWTCADYITAGPNKAGAPWCADGQVTSGNEWALGSVYNYPDDNCCACGKGTVTTTTATTTTQTQGKQSDHLNTAKVLSEVTENPTARILEILTGFYRFCC